MLNQHYVYLLRLVAKAHPEHRQYKCSTFRVMDVAIAYDSSFCNHYGGAAKTESYIADVVAGASKYFEVDGLCTTLRLSHVEGYCNPATDIYRELLDNRNRTHDGVLDGFRHRWRINHPTVKRSAAHLFTTSDPNGVDEESRIQGLAYACALVQQDLCACTDYSYAMEWIYKGVAASEVFAHELAHNFGANEEYDDDGTNLAHTTGYIMNGMPRPGHESKGFSNTSIKEMDTVLGMLTYLGKDPCFVMNVRMMVGDPDFCDLLLVLAALLLLPAAVHWVDGLLFRAFFGGREEAQGNNGNTTS